MTRLNLETANEGYCRFILGYGYGLLAVVVVSMISLAGLFVLPLLNQDTYQHILALFSALAVGTLFGDAMFHLIPFVCVLVRLSITNFRVQENRER